LREERYPYDEWLDGRIWELSYGKEDSDIPVSESGSRQNLAYVAKARGIGVTVAKRGLDQKFLYVQAKQIND